MIRWEIGCSRPYNDGIFDISSFVPFKAKRSTGAMAARTQPIGVPNIEEIYISGTETVAHVGREVGDILKATTFWDLLAPVKFCSNSKIDKIDFHK